MKTLELEATRPEPCPLRQPGTTMAGILPEQESHVLPSSGSPHPDASNSEPNPPSSTPVLTIPAPMTPDKTPATGFNLLSWFRHPLATFKASLKRRRCASSSDNSTAGRKKKAQILDDEEAAEAKARQQEKNKAHGSDHPELLAESVPKAANDSTTIGHIVDCLNDDNDVYVKKEEMAIQGKKEKGKEKEQQGCPENVVNKGDGQHVDNITGGNNHKVDIMSPNSKQPESAPITIEEATASDPVVETAGRCCSEMNQHFAVGIQDAAENAEAATPET